MTRGQSNASKSIAVSAICVGLAAVLQVNAAALPAAAAPRVNSKVLLNGLTVGATYHPGYVRSKFILWSSHPDGCDTREKVLLRDAVTRPAVGSGCSLTNGKWRSPYDGLTITNSTEVQIDHVVPLGAAWGAGAWRWTSATREAFANDLGTHYDLLAVSAHTNESKGDQSPDQWLPPKASFDCRYMADYTAVLWRWQLAINPHQKAFLRHHLRACGWPTVTRPARASIQKHPTGGGGGHKPHTASGIRISRISSDGAHSDNGSNASLNDEWVEVTNTSSKTASLTHWMIRDRADHHYVFPSFSLGAHDAVKIHTGHGSDSGHDLYWASNEYIWNNDGDTAKLLDSNGDKADACTYSGTTSPASC